MRLRGEIGTNTYIGYNKNSQFLPNQADIQANLPTHYLVILTILTKFHNELI